jgi:hypothetical protein
MIDSEQPDSFDHLLRSLEEQAERLSYLDLYTGLDGLAPVRSPLRYVKLCCLFFFRVFVPSFFLSLRIIIMIAS